MIRSFYGIENNPFSHENITLLEAQEDVYQTLVTAGHNRPQFFRN